MTDWNIRKSEDEPHDPLTHLADVAALAAVLDPGFTENHRIVVLITSDDGGGLTFQGYADEEEEAACDAAFDILQHLRVLLRAHGRDLAVYPMPGRG